MSLKYSRIYRISNSSQSSDTALESSPEERNPDPVHSELLGRLKKTLHTHSRKQFGYFDPETPNLSASLEQYFQNKTSFNKCANTLAELLSKQLGDNSQLPQYEYYLWVVTEETSTRNELYLFMLQHKPAFRINSQISLEQIMAIQEEKLQYGVKIHLKECFEAQSETCMSFLSTNTPPGQVFTSFIGFTQGVDRAAQTQQFLDVVEQYAAAQGDTDKEHRQRIADYCLDQDRRGDPIAVDELSRQINSEKPHDFMYYLADRMEQPPSNLYADPGSLKRYTRLYGRDDELTISFAVSAFGSTILYDEKSDTLTIRRIPKSLKKQLSKL